MAEESASSVNSVSFSYEFNEAQQEEDFATQLASLKDQLKSVKEELEMIRGDIKVLESKIESQGKEILKQGIELLKQKNICQITDGFMRLVSDYTHEHTYNRDTIFIMRRFSQHRNDGNEWQSGPIYTDRPGYKICLSVVAKGTSFGKNSHVSVFIHFMRGVYDDTLKWPFRGVISFQLLDQHGGGNHKEGTVTYDHTVDESVCTRVREGETGKGKWGYIRFIPHGDLEPYLKDDSLHFEFISVELH